MTLWTTGRRPSVPGTVGGKCPGGSAYPALSPPGRARCCPARYEPIGRQRFSHAAGARGLAASSEPLCCNGLRRGRFLYVRSSGYRARPANAPTRRHAPAELGQCRAGRTPSSTGIETLEAYRSRSCRSGWRWLRNVSVLLSRERVATPRRPGTGEYDARRSRMS